MAGRLTALLVDAGRLLSQVGEGDSQGAELTDLVFAELERRYAEPLSLAHIASVLHISRGHLTTTVRKHTGRTVQERIAERRLTEARRLLVETRLPIREVARRVGYPDRGYFSRVFRAAHGTTPQAWRSAH